MNDSEKTFLEVSDILESFNIDEINKLIEEQITTDYNDDIYSDLLTNHLQPLYYNYASLTKYDLDEETKSLAENKFVSICVAFLNAIINRFKISIDTEWLSSHYSDVPAITMFMYSFFVIDFQNNVYEILVNYIEKNNEEIAKVFSGMKVKKDASSIANKKDLSPEMSMIISNIYDIEEWVFNHLDVDDYFTYLDNSYLPLSWIKGFFEDGHMSGDFADVIAQIIRKNISLRSKIGFNYTFQVKNGEIQDLFKESK